jgi:hypothetical protein
VFVLDIVVSDGHGTANGHIEFRIAQSNALDFAISEIDVASGYLEMTNLGADPVDVSGWRFRFWTGTGTAPVSMTFDTLPGISLAMPGSVMMLGFGGTAGGTWPSFNAGVAFPAMTGHEFAWQVVDSSGTTVNFVRTTGVTPANLTDETSAALSIPAEMLARPPLAPGFGNYSLGTSAFLAAASGTPGAANPALPTEPLGFHWSALPPAVAGLPYFGAVVPMGGVAPYTLSLLAPQAPWLSIHPGTGTLSGTVPSGPATVLTIDITATDATSATVTRTISVPLVADTPVVAPTIRVGHVSADRADGSMARVPVRIQGVNAAIGMTSLSFIAEPLAGDSLELWRVMPGEAAVAAGVVVEAVRVSGGRTLVTCRKRGGGPVAIQDGVVAVLVHRVKGTVSGMAAAGLTPVSLSGAALEATAGTTRVGMAAMGTIDISEFRPQDANRDATIDVVDVQLMVNVLLALNQPGFPSQGDANRDGVLDVVDVQTVVNCILSGGC